MPRGRPRKTDKKAAALTKQPAPAPRGRKGTMHRAPTQSSTVYSIRHQDKRANIPTEELRDFVQAAEQKPAHSLEHMDQVKCYVKNQSLGFFIPYVINGEEKNYVPDFIARMDDGHGPDDLLNLIIEVTGEPRPEKEIKVATARDLWVPAVNNHGGFGRWAFLEIRDPWNAKNEIQQFNRG